MKLKKFFRLLIKFTLLDELVGFIYWAAALYGLYLITNNGLGGVVLPASLIAYIILISIVYILFLKKIKKFFKDSQQ